MFDSFIELHVQKILNLYGYGSVCKFVIVMHPAYTIRGRNVRAINNRCIISVILFYYLAIIIMIFVN